MVHHAGFDAMLLRESPARLASGRFDSTAATRAGQLLPGAGTDDGFHIGASPGNQDDNIFHRAILPRQGV